MPLEVVVHGVSENLVHWNILLPGIFNEIFNVDHHLVVSGVTIHRDPILKGVVVDGGDIPSRDGQGPEVGLEGKRRHEGQRSNRSVREGRHDKKRSDSDDAEVGGATAFSSLGHG